MPANPDTKNAFSRARLATASLGIAALLILATSANASQSLPADTHRLTAFEIYVLVREKSWKWDDGAGRFIDKGRQFIGWADGKDGPAFAKGRFQVTKSGRLCLVAEWHSQSGVAHDRTCFENREAKGVIYQRRSGSRNWYVFSHTPPEPTDEYSKFVSEDLVSDKLAEIEASMQNTHSTQKGGNQ